MENTMHLKWGEVEVGFQARADNVWIAKIARHAFTLVRSYKPLLGGRKLECWTLILDGVEPDSFGTSPQRLLDETYGWMESQTTWMDGLAHTFAFVQRREMLNFGKE